jgi:hypothetical protein
MVRSESVSQPGRTAGYRRHGRGRRGRALRTAPAAELRHDEDNGGDHQRAENQDQDQTETADFHDTLFLLRLKRAGL